MGGVGALDDRRQLRIADTGHLARGADRAGADADLDDVGARQDQLFGHLAGDDVAGHDHQMRVRLADARHEGGEVLVVAVGHVEAHVADVVAGRLHHLPELLLVGAGDTDRVERRRLAGQLAEKVDVLGHRVVLVQRDRQAERRQRVGHLDGAGAVHVGGDDRDAVVGLLAVAEAELARDVDVGARGQRRALRADQHVLEVQLEFMLDVHGCFPLGPSASTADRTKKAPALPQEPSVGGVYAAANLWRTRGEPAASDTIQCMRRRSEARLPALSGARRRPSLHSAAHGASLFLTQSGVFPC